MITTGILNPQILALLARVRHTNALVIADRGFPCQHCRLLARSTRQRPKNYGGGLAVVPVPIFG